MTSRHPAPSTGAMFGLSGRYPVLWVLLLMTGVVSSPLCAATGASSSTGAVLAFELNDLTLDPGGEAEQSRTASIAPMLREALAAEYGFDVVAVDTATQQNADKAFGYLFDHEDVAAGLGRRAGSDWIVVGRVHKPSFLFVYLKARVVDTQTMSLVADLTVEIKGSNERLTKKGVQALARQIASALGSATADR